LILYKLIKISNYRNCIYRIFRNYNTKAIEDEQQLKAHRSKIEQLFVLDGPEAEIEGVASGVPAKETARAGGANCEWAGTFGLE
jgi:hypothetical protein